MRLPKQLDVLDKNYVIITVFKLFDILGLFRVSHGSRDMLLFRVFTVGRLSFEEF